MTEPVSPAKQTLLRAFDSIEELEQQTGSEVRHVAVVYTLWDEDENGVIHDNSGWNHSPAPAWLIGAMLRESAEEIEMAAQPVDPDDG